MKNINFIKNLNINTLLNKFYNQPFIFFIPKLLINKKYIDYYNNLQKYVFKFIFKVDLKNKNFNNLIYFFFNLNNLNKLKFYFYSFFFCIKFYNFYFYYTFLSKNIYLIFLTCLKFFFKLKHIIFYITFKNIYSFLKFYYQ